MVEHGTGGEIEAILESVPCGFLSFADSGTVVAANQTLLQMLEREDRNLSGQHVETILTLPSRIFYQTHFFPLLKMSGMAEEIYLSLRTATGGELPVLVNAARVERSGQTFNDCVLMAMRRRSRYEDEILRAKKDLEEANRTKESLNVELEIARGELERKQTELQDRNLELESLKSGLEEQVEERTAELQTAVQDLEGFSYAIAHDLRAPLRAIVSTSEILREETSESLSEEHLALLARQSFNGRKLATLIDDLLRFARLGREGIVRNPVNLSALATEVIAGASRPGISFSVQAGMRTTGDPALIRIVLENLIGNAVKYSPGGGEIRVGSSAEFAGSVFYVKDQGIGFDVEFAHKIFLPFERLHPPGQFEGNGIGLATVRRIIERHGGAIWVESAPGAGSTFFFSLGA